MIQEAQEQLDLDPVNEICQRFYPNQINVLQATTQTQYWLDSKKKWFVLYLSNEFNLKFWKFIGWTVPTRLITSTFI